MAPFRSCHALVTMTLLRNNLGTAKAGAGGWVRPPSSPCVVTACADPPQGFGSRKGLHGVTPRRRKASPCSRGQCPAGLGAPRLLPEGVL